MSRARARVRAVHVVPVLAIGVLVLLPRALPASVEAQRARLPPPAACTDPVVGEWRAHNREAQRDGWYIFTLRIRRAAPGSPVLTGEIRNEWWSGTAEQAQPPPCAPGLDHWTVAMTAAGRTENGRVQFGGTSWRFEQLLCGRYPWGYNLDQFSGVLEPDRQEFQSVNNDGGRMVNEPTVFRRIRCIDGAETTTATMNVVPPPFFPRTRSRGCSR